MAQVVANWWGGLSDMHKGLSVIVATALATVAATLSGLEQLGVPARMDSAEIAIEANTEAIDGLGDLLRTLERGQDLTNCLLLAEANGANPLECAR